VFLLETPASSKVIVSPSRGYRSTFHEKRRPVINAQVRAQFPHTRSRIPFPFVLRPRQNNQRLSVHYRHLDAQRLYTKHGL
jgi:hypothetical protein